MRVLITGGAGFVGGNLAVFLRARHAGWEVVALDNLRRRGSELQLPRLREAGVRFVHGDVRSRSDLASVGEVEAIVECSAEPSVLAGMSAAEYVVETNLIGAANCLELARAHGSFLVFISTSRVYPLAALRSLALEEAETRFELAAGQELPGASPHGIAEDFPLAGARTLYGSSKLAAELLIAEYEDSFGVRAVVNRCGVVAGPWQMGKVDQGVFTYWLLAHRLGRELTYLGYGGSGKQVRDLLHVDDLADLIDAQLQRPEEWTGFVGNVGGGREHSLSLLETTELCRDLTGSRVPVRAVPEERPGDVPLYLSDCRRLFARSGWRPRHDPARILADTFDWLCAHERLVVGALGEDPAG
jgi:CDP-paratose 2-epimerase